MSGRPGRRLRDTQGSPWASSSGAFPMPVKGFWIFPSEAEQAQLRAPGWRGVTHSASGGGSRSSQRGELTPFLLGQLRHHLGAARSRSTPATGLVCCVLQGLTRVPGCTASVCRFQSLPGHRPRRPPRPQPVPTRPPRTPARAASPPWSSLTRRESRWTPPSPPSTPTTVTRKPGARPPPASREGAVVRRPPRRLGLPRGSVFHSCP